MAARPRAVGSVGFGSVGFGRRVQRQSVSGRSLWPVTVTGHVATGSTPVSGNDGWRSPAAPAADASG